MFREEGLEVTSQKSTDHAPASVATGTFSPRLLLRVKRARPFNLFLREALEFGLLCGLASAIQLLS